MVSYRYALKYEVDNKDYKSELFGNEFSIYKKTKTKFRKKVKLELVCRVYLCCFENGDLLKIKQPKESGEKYAFGEYKEP